MKTILPAMPETQHVAALILYRQDSGVRLRPQRWIVGKGLVMDADDIQIGWEREHNGLAWPYPMREERR